MDTANNIDALKYADESLRSDAGFMLEVVKLDARAFEFATEDLKSDEKFVLEAIKNNKQVINYVHDGFKSDPEFMFNAIVHKVDVDEWYENEIPGRLTSARPSLDTYGLDTYGLEGWKKMMKGKHVRRHADQVDSIDIDMLDFLSDDLRSNEKFMLRLLKIDSHVINYVHEDLLINPNIQRFNKKSWQCLEGAPFDIKDNKEIVLDIMREDGFELEFASDKLKADKEVVFAAVQFDGSNLQFADKTLQGDQEIVLEAIANADHRGDMEKDYPMIYASYKLVSNKEFMLKAVKIDPLSYFYLSAELESDKDLFLEALKSWKMKWDEEEAVHYLVNRDNSFHYSDDSAFALKILEITSLAFDSFNQELQNSKDFILEAVKVNSSVLEYVADKFKSDKDIILATITGNNDSNKISSDISTSVEKYDENIDSNADASNLLHKNSQTIDFDALELLRKRMLLSVTDLASILGISRMSYYTWLEGGEIRKSNIKKINSKIDKLKNVISKYNWPNNVLELNQKDRKAKLIKLLEQC